MKNFTLPFLNKEKILALGAESEGIFAFYQRGKIFISDNFGDLTNENNFFSFKKEINKIFKKHRLKIILTDLHPLYNTTIYGKILSQKFNLKLINVQHHLAHIFSALGDQIMLNNRYDIPDTFFGIACDGTGYGLDGKIWGGEIFKFEIRNSKFEIQRIGHLKNQTMISGDLAVKEPARMLIAILAKIPNSPEGQFYGEDKFQKDFIYKYVKKFYTRNEFELLHSQLQQNFNCQETSSTGRVLDAVSVLLGFAENKRKHKHEAAELLEKNSTKPYSDLRPKLQITNYKLQTPKHPPSGGDRGQVNSKFKIQNSKFILETTPLFEYLIKNLHKDKKRLAATAQLYLAKGFYEIIKQRHPELACLAELRRVSGSNKKDIPNQVLNDNVFFAGGIANNKIISAYLENKGVYVNKKIPRGDAGLSFGQIIYYLFSK